MELKDGQIVAVTSMQTEVIIKGSSHTMQTTDHEEADTKIMLHIIDAMTNTDCKSFMIKTVDTDVVVIDWIVFQTHT